MPVRQRVIRLIRRFHPIHSSQMFIRIKWIFIQINQIYIKQKQIYIQVKINVKNKGRLNYNALKTLWHTQLKQTLKII